MKSPAPPPPKGGIEEDTPFKKNSFFYPLWRVGGLLLNIIVVVFLLFSYSAFYVSPDSNLWWLQLFGLAYGFILIANAAFVLFWLLMRRKSFLLSLIAILIGAGRIFGIIEPPHFSKEEVAAQASSIPPSAGGGALKVMSFNVRLFDLYNWFHNLETKQKIFDFLHRESPDIVCFQEYYHSDNKPSHYTNNDVLPSVIPAPYSHIEYNLTIHNDHWGIATYSKYPIINRQAVHFKKKGGNIFIYSDIVAGSDTFRVVNAHLESIRFKGEDYKYIENIGTEVEQEDVAGGIRILRQMKRAFSRRAKQVEVLKDSINASPYPVIVCGDFNDTPSSYTYHKISEGLVDSFRESGSGFGKTYAGLFPSFRIDYILHDKRLKGHGYVTHHEKLSDHYAISTVITQ